jgi:hypothetical protein
MSELDDWVRGHANLLAALFIWCLPTLVFCGIVLATMPRYSGADPNALLTTVILLFGFLFLLIYFPVMLLSAASIGHFTLFSILVWVYFVGAYGLLGFLWFSHRKKS